MSTPLQAGIVYGPVPSRRLGPSLGINILPPGRKYCNFNCPYCQYGWTAPAVLSSPSCRWPRVDAIAEAVETALQINRDIARITLAGNGEPTLHPQFPAIVDALLDSRARRAPRARLAILSNSSTLESHSVVAALRRLDDRFMKLDAGDATTLRRMNASPVSIEIITDGLSRLGSVVVQAMFARDGGPIDNTTPGAIGAWLAALARVGPKAVHLYSLDRAPALSRLQRVTRAELQAIALRVETLGIPAQVF